MAKLASKLPKGDANGLTAIDKHLVDDPTRVHAVIALVDCSRVTTDTDTGDVVPTARVRRIEAVLTGEHLEVIERIMRRSMEQRTGMAVLPIEIEDELQEVFDRIKVDPETGEVLDGD